MTAATNDPFATDATDATAGGRAVAVRDLTHRYGERTALDRLTFDVAPGEIFGLLGPNGGGKSTLFRILATLLPVAPGRAAVHGFDVAARPDAVRGVLGVTFQSPALDAKLTVGENLRYAGQLYGLRGRTLRDRIAEVAGRLHVGDRLKDYAEELSGGLKRRVEIAKGLLHAPRVLLLDEPSTGLDPTARFDLWRFLAELREAEGVTVLVTTHLMEEAERCDRLGILDEGTLVALGTPDDLRAEVGGDVLTFAADEPREFAAELGRRFGVEPAVVDRAVRVEAGDGADLLRSVMAELGDSVRTVTLGRPTLEDVFTARTGRAFQRTPTAPPADKRGRTRKAA